MTKSERELIGEALILLRQLPSGIDPESVDESDTSPEDAVWHIGSIAAKRLMEALDTPRSFGEFAGE